MTRPSHVLAIDPGMKGALAVLCLSDKSLQVYDTPTKDGGVDGVKLAFLLNQIDFQAGRSLQAVIEQVGSLPRQQGAFAFGLSTGKIHGVLDALGVPYSLAPPSQWKPAMGLRKLPNETTAQNKTRARELATHLWSERAKDFARVKDDGRAEACLLSRWFATKNGWL
jgi:crossover junction endodeoxyribonuclease RuvC